MTPARTWSNHSTVLMRQVGVAHRLVRLGGEAVVGSVEALGALIGVAA